MNGIKPRASLILGALVTSVAVTKGRLLKGEFILAHSSKWGIHHVGVGSGGGRWPEEEAERSSLEALVKSGLNW